jgi:Tol biopolymer transport system component
MKTLMPCLATTLVILLGDRLCAQSITRASVSSSQVQSNGWSFTPSVSADGRHIVFTSNASNLVTGDTNGAYDIFDHDTWTGATARVSLTNSGAEANSQSDLASISADGRYVAFESTSTNLVGSTSPAAWSVYIRDLLAGTTTRVSVDSSGNPATTNSFAGGISGDGRFVAFVCASQLTPNDQNLVQDVFVRDVQARVTTLVSVGTSGTSGNADSAYPSISADGRFVAFMSNASDLVAGDTNGASDIFVRDTQTGTTLAATVDPNWIIGNQGSSNPSISASGRYVAFASTATNLVLGDTNGASDVFVRDMQSLTFSLASVDSSGVQAQGGSSASSLSSDGRFVAFISDASNLVPGDTNGHLDVFVHDNQSGSTTRVSAVSSEGNGDSHSPSISTGGSLVAFWSNATNLVSGDTNGFSDVFFYDPLPCGGYPTYCTAKVNSQGCLPEICANGVPSFSGPDDFHVTAHHVLNNKTGILLWSYSQGNLPLGGGTLCLGSPFKRTPAQNSGGTPGVNDCSGAYSFWFSQGYMLSKGIPAGAVVYAQYWSRDPFFPPPNNIGLTDGIQFTVQP